MQGLTDLASTCHNHSEIQAHYFISDQPWMKFCAECALNLAVSGRKIQKQLSAQQYDNQTKLTQIKQKIKEAVVNADTWHSEMGEMASKTERQGEQQLRKTLVEFDKYVSQLCRLREIVVEMYEQNFGRRAQDLYERQTKIMLIQIQLKRESENIQMNFRKIVQNKTDVTFPHKISSLEASLEKINKERLQTNEKETLLRTMEEVKAEINKKIIERPVFNDSECCDKKEQEQKTEKPMFIKTTTQSRVSSLMSLGDENISNLSKSSQKTITHLKLRSRSKRSQKRGEKTQSCRKNQKSIRDISNIIKLSPFQL